DHVRAAPAPHARRGRERPVDPPVGLHLPLAPLALRLVPPGAGGALVSRSSPDDRVVDQAPACCAVRRSTALADLPPGLDPAHALADRPHGRARPAATGDRPRHGARARAVLPRELVVAAVPARARAGRAAAEETREATAKAAAPVQATGREICVRTAPRARSAQPRRSLGAACADGRLLGPRNAG